MSANGLLIGLSAMFLIWFVFLFVLSPAVRQKVRIPNSWAGQALLVLLTIFLAFGHGAARFVFAQSAYFLTPFLQLGTAFLLFYNFRIWGFVLSGLGFLTNAVVMLSNTLRMPMNAELIEFVNNPIYTPITDKTILPFLADCLAINLSPYVLVFSIGDVFIVFGFLATTIYLTYVLVEEKAGATKER